MTAASHVQKITVEAAATHPMIPPYREMVKKIRTLTGLNAKPQASGLQVTPPFMLVCEGTDEHLQILQTNGIKATMEPGIQPEMALAV